MVAAKLSGTPVAKQLSRLEASKKRWKAKHAQLKAQMRRMENQVRAVEKSRAQWRAKAEQAQAALKKTLRSNPR
jgi:predicted  nucleic acid-binding Zn-ribbon protein